MSPAQQRIWFLNQYDTTTPTYNIPLTLHLTGHLDTTALHHALTHLIHRHQPLHTTYPLHHGHPTQHIHPHPTTPPLTPTPTTETQLPHHINADTTQPFDLTTDTPLHTHLYQLDTTHHTLTLVLHHIAADGHSLTPLTHDLTTAYTAHTHHQPPHTTPPPLTYTDYTHWQHQLLGTPDHPTPTTQTQTTYWTTTLTNLPDTLPLPTDRPRPTHRTHHGQSVRFEIPADVHRRLRALARSTGATTFMTLHAAFAVLLARLCDTDDVVIGTPVAGRPDPRLDQLVGMFVGTLVLRTPVDSADSFREVLTRTRDADLGAFMHADVPFEMLVDVLAPERSTTHTPLFQVLIDYGTEVPLHLELPDLTVTVAEDAPPLAKFDLQLTLREHADPAHPGLSAALTYATDIFDRTTVESVAVRFLRLLDSVTADPARPVGDVDLLDATERATLTTGWNTPSPVAEPAEATLADRFTRSVHRFAGESVLTDADETLTYAALGARVYRLARRLVELGAAPDTVVAVALPPSIDLVVALLAAQQAGAGYLALDVGHPADRLDATMSDAAPVCLVSSTDHAARLRRDLPTVLVDDADTRGCLMDLSPEPITDPERRAGLTPDAVAYVVYTSGSTGRPKGVVVTHRNVATLFDNTRTAFEFAETDVWTLFHSAAFDFSVWELWGALLHGGRLVVVDTVTARSPDEFLGLLGRERVTVLCQTPTAFAQLAAAERNQPTDLALRCVVFGGEALEHGHLVDWLDRHQPTRPQLVNMYGITETTVHVTRHPLGDTRPAARSVIGRAVPGLRVYVLDRRLHPVPTGVTGEMYVAGNQVTRGYLHRSGLTVTRYVADPAGRGERMYRTGDLARWTAQGQLEFLGRSDAQVQLHGYRIEPGEVEATLVRHPDVAQAAVSVRSDDRGAERLIGYVVPARDGAQTRTVDIGRVLGFARTTLAPQMVPATLVVLDRLPLTPNGKLDRRQLPAPDFAEHVATGRAPATVTETALAAVFAEVLGVPSVSADESFFALGGDSIMAIQLVARAHEDGVFVTPRDVFEHQTVAALAEVAATRNPDVLAELPGGGVGTAPLVPIARWLLERGGNLDTYCQAVLLTAPPDLDTDTLTATVQTVLDHHDMLRARLRRGISDQDTVLEIPPAGIIAAAPLITHVAVETHSDNDLAAMARAQLDAATHRLDPENGIMLQLVWLDPRTQPGHLLITIHHLATDGVSWRILIPDLATAHHAHTTGTTPTLPPVTTTARRYAHALTDTTTHRTHELPHWRNILTTPDPPLGTRPLDPTHDTENTTTHTTIELPPHTTHTLLTTLPTTYHCGIDDALLTALALAITTWRHRHHTPTHTLLVNIEGHGRTDPLIPGADLTRTIGWFTTIHPTLLDLTDIDLDNALTGGPATGHALTTIKEQLHNTPDHGTGYGPLRYLNPHTATQLRNLPQPQTTLNYLGRFDYPPHGPSNGTGWEPVTSIEFDTTILGNVPVTAILDVNAYVYESGGVPILRATWVYPPGVLPAADVTELTDLWTEALTALADHISRPGAGRLTPSDLDLVHLDQTTLDALHHHYPTLTDVWPLTPLQAGLLFHHELTSQALDTYVVQLVLDIDGPLDPDRLRDAADTLLGRHPNLRAAFGHTPDGTPIQIVTPATLPWNHHDLSDERDGTVAHDIVTTDRTTAFDLTAPPLLRLTLITHGPTHHQIALTHHHILLDGWSTPLLLHELLQLYEHHADPGAVPRPLPYRRYLEWLTQQSLEESRAAWADVLDGLEGPTILLPSARGRVPSTFPDEYRVSLSREHTDGLRTVARTHDLTLHTILDTAWALVLATHTATTDITFGTTVSGRPPHIPGIETMIGLFINTIPVRITLHPTDTLTTLLHHTHATHTQLLDHHHLPLTHIPNPHATTFDTITVHENYPHHTTPPTDLTITTTSATDATHYPLALAATTTDTTLHLKFEFLPEFLSRNDTEAIAAHMCRALEVIATAPETTVASVRLLGDDEFRALAPVRGGPAPATRTLATIVTDAAALDPDAVALEDSGRAVSYRDLDEASNRLARLLITHGAGPERYVALAIPRSADSVLAVWAIAKTGAAFVPIDPGYPAARIADMIADSGVALGVTLAPQRERLPDTVPWLVLDEPGTITTVDQQSSGALGDADRRGPLLPDHPAYLIYTSGSTGVPKGVVVPHRGLATLAAAQAAGLGPGRHSRVLHFSSPSFDGSVFDYLLAFGCGATLVISPPTIVGGTELSRFVAAQRVTHAFVPTAALASADPDDLDGYDGFGEILVAGEACPPGLVTRWSRGRALRNGYGPTETTVMSNISAPLTPGSEVTIGGPVAGADEVVLDARLQPVPDGVPGELYIAGSGLARGYHRRPGLTAGRFVTAPYGPAGERMYRTGDIVRWVADTSGGRVVEYLGRADFQVKVRGFRIEPGEIDSVLGDHPDVEYAATLTRTGPAGDPILVSYVVGSAELAPARLSAYLTERLPAHMVPGAIVPIDRIPLTPVGKLDRAALPAPRFDSPADPAHRPTSPVEETVANAFAAVLGLEHVGVDDNFFEAGGNSLTATRVVARVNSMLHTHIDVRTVFEDRTPRVLSTHLDHDSNDAPLPVPTPGNQPEFVPLSPAQQRIWFLNQYDTTTPTYNIPLTLHLTGHLDTTALHHALTHLIHRHQPLHTTYPLHHGHPTQHIHPHPTTPPLTPTPTTETQLPHHINADTTQPFDLTTDTPLHTHLYQLDTTHHTLTLVLHHIAADGHSLTPLTHDLTTAYTAHTHHQPPHTTPPPLTYTDYTHWQHQLLGTPDHPTPTTQTQTTYWTTTLTNLPDTLPLPTDRPRPTHRTHHGDRVAFRIGRDLHRSLSTLARQNNSTLFMAIHALFAVLLARLSGSSDIVIGTPVAGRPDPRLDQLVGMFVNTLVLRTPVDGSRSFTEVLDRTRDVDLGAFLHADLPFERVVEAVDPPRSTSRSPLFQVSLEFESVLRPEITLPDLTVTVAEYTPPVVKVDLELVVAETFDESGAPDGIAAGFTYATDIFDAATVQGFADRLTRLVAAVVSDPDDPVGDLTLGDENEDASVSGPPGLPARVWPDLLAGAAERHSDRVAVCDAGRTLTYRQLDADSAQFARLLIARGAAPERFVALALPRSLAWVRAVWAVARSGSASVPVDPTYPPTRITHMLDDCGAVLGVTVARYRTQLPDTVEWLVLDDPDLETQMRHLPATPVTDVDRAGPLHPDNPAYLIYTSGSTGTPKGVVVSHRGLSNLFEQERHHLQVTPDARVSHLASPSFDAALFELTMAFCAGARVVLVPPLTYGGAALADILAGERITHAFITPTALASLDPTGLDSLQVLTVAGEPCPADLVRRWAPARRMLDAYGPTETTIWSHVSEPLAPAEPVTIGHPVRGFTAAVLDARLHPVPPGTPGELYLAGPGLARGYHARPATTATHFVACPFAAPGSRMYRTGDLVRTRPDLTLEHLGRTDFQIKVRGFRVEPGEVDSILAARADIGFAATVGRTGPDGEPILVTYVRGATGADVDASAVRTALSAQLPPYLVPAAVVVLDEVPLTPAGKLDRSALPEPEFGPRPERFRAPSTAVERAVVEAFAKVVDTGEDRAIGVDDDFFALGGTSLSAVRVAADLQRRLGRPVPLPALFLDPTPAGLAARLTTEALPASVEDALRVVVPLRRGGRLAPLFCVHAGMGLAWAYTGMVRHLSPDRPVWGLQLPSLGGGPEYDSIEKLAHRYLDEVRTVQPAGPYHLLGWSLGGLIAHAMATELQDRGEEVGSLVLLDSYPGGATADPEALDAGDLLRGLGVDGSPGEDARSLTYADVGRRLGESYGPAAALTADQLRRIAEGYARSTRLSTRFAPRVFRGDALLLTAADSSRAGGAPSVNAGLGHSITGTVQDERVDCAHNDMMQPGPARAIGVLVETYVSGRGG
ncbi:amino acid adenylation domain-containing protein [Rhodococcus opacus]